MRQAYSRDKDKGGYGPMDILRILAWMVLWPLLFHPLTWIIIFFVHRHNKNKSNNQALISHNNVIQTCCRGRTNK